MWPYFRRDDTGMRNFRNRSDRFLIGENSDTYIRFGMGIREIFDTRLGLGEVGFRLSGHQF